MNVGPDGLPTAFTVPLLGGDSQVLNVAADAGYGFTEGVLNQGDRHNRLNLGVAAGWTPLPGWSASLQLGGRYDGHKLDNGRHDSGIIIRPRLAGRGVFDLKGGFFLGGQLALQPGPSFSPRKAFSGFAGEVDALAGVVQGAMQLSGRLGFRYDRGRHAVDNANSLSLADRLALGVSDAPEIRVGLGGLYALIPMLSLLGEVTWDIPVGGKAVKASAGPLWLRAGARMPLGERFQLGLIAGVSPSSRPAPQPTGPLVRVDPRLFVGLTFAAVVLDNPATANEAPEVEVAPAMLVVTVTGIDDLPLSGAIVETGGQNCTTGDDGTCSLRAMVNDPRSVHVEVAGYASVDQAYEASATDQELAIALTALPAAVYGQLLNAQEEPVAGARISVLRGDRQFDGTTDEQGAFVIADQEPGPAVLRIEAQGAPPSEQDIIIEPGMPPLALTTGRPEDDRHATGQIRGTVRTFDGTPIAATVVITPKKREIQCDDKGEFAVDLPKGRYRVLVRAPGYRPQRRTADVEPHGVAVLVIELTAKK